MFFGIFQKNPLTKQKKYDIMTLPLLQGFLFVPFCRRNLYLREANEPAPAVSRRTGGVYEQEVPIMRVKVTLACTECKRRNYVTKKNKRNNPERIEMNKHCKFCRKHTLHRETK